MSEKSQIESDESDSDVEGYWMTKIPFRKVQDDVVLYSVHPRVDNTDVINSWIAYHRCSSRNLMCYHMLNVLHDPMLRSTEI